MPTPKAAVVEQPPPTDLTRLVVIMLGAALILAVALIGGLSLVALLREQSLSIPDVLQNIAVGCLAGLVGILAPNRTN